MTNEKQQNRKTFIDCYRIGRSLEYMDRYDQEQAWKKMNSAIQRKRLHRRISYMSSVAAMVAIAFTSFYLWRGEDQAPAEKLADAQETVGQSGRPGVILSLSDGRRIDLSAREGKIGAGEEVVNHPENKQLFYAADQGGEKISRMNRLDVPQGAEYHLVLSDGTRVWMNARSRLVYPVAFGDTREVELEGEAYFEVTRDENRPFIVHAGQVAVKVLGTEFNVNTCRKQKVQTVLVKGSVQVENGGKREVVLRPGELAETVGTQIRVTQVNVRKYTAWREGVFYFEEADLEEIMTELADWYCVQAVFTDQTVRTRKFSGVLERSETIENVLKKIERTTSVHFTIQQGIIQVK